MAHDPRVFIGPGQDGAGTGHQIHAFSATSPAVAAMVANAKAYGLTELTTAQYAAWDSGSRTHKDIMAHGT